MQEVYNWISAVDIKDERQVNVRQFVRGSTWWIGDDGKEYDITQLDFTKKAEAPSFITEMNERMKRTDEEHDRTQAQLREMLASMDAKAIADHQAEIDERAYWRKLRGDIALAIISQKSEKLSLRSEDEWVLIAYKTDQFLDMLYNQDKEFKI